MKTLKAWVVLTERGTIKEFIDSRMPVFYDTKREADDTLFGDERTVHVEVEIRELKPKRGGRDE